MSPAIISFRASSPKENPVPKILLLEDDTFLQKAIHRSFKLLGYKHVKAVSCPEDAIKLLDDGYKPDFILSDLQMPGMDGDAFCRIVKARLPEVPVVLHSGSVDVYRRGHEAGADHTYKKPIRRDDLIALLEQYVPLTPPEGA